MSFFVSREEVPVSLDGDDVPFEERNTIFIKPKMDFGTLQRVRSAFLHVSAGADGKSKGDMDWGAYNSALLHNNITRWQGPGFQAMPCTPENIDRLDPDLPLLDKVLQEINERNKEKEAATDPNLLTSASPSASTRRRGAALSVVGQSETGT